MYVSNIVAVYQSTKYIVTSTLKIYFTWKLNIPLKKYKSFKPPEIWIQCLLPFGRYIKKILEAWISFGTFYVWYEVF